MGSTRRKPFTIGGSNAITIPQGMVIGEEVSVAADDRLLLVDVTGEVPADKLFEYFTTDIQPKFNLWWENEKKKREVRNLDIPLSLWERVYQVSGRLKPTRESYGEAQQQFVEAALITYLDKWEKELKEKNLW